jgi:hypothetical protein
VKESRQSVPGRRQDVGEEEVALGARGVQRPPIRHAEGQDARAGDGGRLAGGEVELDRELGVARGEGRHAGRELPAHEVGAQQGARPRPGDGPGDVAGAGQVPVAADDPHVDDVPVVRVEHDLRDAGAVDADHGGADHDDRLAGGDGAGQQARRHVDAGSAHPSLSE